MQQLKQNTLTVYYSALLQHPTTPSNTALVHPPFTGEQEVLPFLYFQPRFCIEFVGASVIAQGFLGGEVPG